MKCQKKLLVNILVIILLAKINNLPALANENPNIQNDKKPTVALVLSGGGARGIAHIGMLKYLEDNNIKIDYIIGTSIGAIIGGLYSTGYSATQIDSIFTTVDWQNVFTMRLPNNRENIFFDQKKIQDRSILMLRFDNFKLIRPEAFSEGYVINDFLQNCIINSDFFYVNNFDSLKYPFRAIATDLVSGQSIALKSGNLAKAIRASSLLPIAYSPAKINDMILVDGGIMANIPVRFAKEFNPDIIIAMDATSPIHTAEVLNAPLRIADQVISISMEHFARLDAKLADILIVPQIDNQNYLDFSNAGTLINIGYNATKEKLEPIKSKFAKANPPQQNRQIIITKIDVIHNKYDSPKVIFADFPLKIGDTLTSENLLLCYNYFERTNKFDDINIQVVSNGADSSVLRIELKEIGNQTLRFTGRFDNERQAQLGIDFVTRNIFSTNLINQISLLGNENTRYAGITFFNPFIFNQNISANITTYYQWRDIKLYELTTTSSSIRAKVVDTNFIRQRGAKASIGVNMENRGLLNLEYRIENQTYGNLQKLKDTVGNGDAISNDFVSLIGFSIYYDSENVPFFATSGKIINVSLETNLFSSNIYSEFAKLTAFFKTNINFGKHNLAPSLFFGAGDRTLPYPEFFSLGGQDNFFGMREYEEMGRQVFRTSIDYRYELPYFLSILSMKSYISARYDLGSIWDMPEQIKFSTLKHGIGGSISIDTPIGPAILSLGRAFSFLRMNKETLHIRFGSPLLYFRLGMNL